MITLQDIIDRWNQDADVYNQWPHLPPDEQMEYVVACMNEVIDELQNQIIDLQNEK